MKAYFTGIEINVELTSEEISELEHKALTGKIRVREVKRDAAKTGDFELGIRHGNDFIFEALPESAGLHFATAYVVRISEEEYADLLVTGQTKEKIGILKINVHDTTP